MNTPGDEGDVAAREATGVPSPPETPGGPPPGWYDDPSSPNAQRYWDGSAWTNHLAPSPAPQTVAGRKSSKATASLVLGILGIFVLPIIFSVLAIIFAVSARSEMDKDPGIENRGSATAGLWLGIVGLAAWAVILIAVSGV